MSKLKMGADGVEPPESKGSRFKPNSRFELDIYMFDGGYCS